LGLGRISKYLIFTLLLVALNLISCGNKGQNFVLKSEQAGGLAVGSKVVYGGHLIGEVTKLFFKRTNFIFDVAITEEINLTESTTFSIDFDNVLLGQKRIIAKNLGNGGGLTDKDTVILKAHKDSNLQLDSLLKKGQNYGGNFFEKIDSIHLELKRLNEHLERGKDLETN